jgi:hypothetical protein
MIPWAKLQAFGLRIVGDVVAPSPAQAEARPATRITPPKARQRAVFMPFALLVPIGRRQYALPPQRAKPPHALIHRLRHGWCSRLADCPPRHFCSPKIRSGMLCNHMPAQRTSAAAETTGVSC